MMLTKVLSCIALLLGDVAVAFSPISSSHTRITRDGSGTALYLYSTAVDESTLSDGRRTFLATLIAGSLMPLTANADGGADYKAVAKDIAAIIKADPNKGPTLVRLVS